METLIQVVVAILLVLLNGFFVASEFALVAVRKTRIQELVKSGSSSARLIQRALQDLDIYISSTQLGITIASLALGWIGEPALAHLILPLFSVFPDQIQYISAHTFAVAIAFIIITFLHIVVGELAPKTMALQRAETVASVLIGPLTVFTTIFQPVIWLLNTLGNYIVSAVGFKPATHQSAVHSEEEVKLILAQSAKSGVIPQEEIEMVYNVFKLGDIPVKRILVPRTEIVAFPMTASVDEVIKRIRKHTLSRFPVYDHSIDSIRGFIHIKDIYFALAEKKLSKTLSQLAIVHEILRVPESKKADDVLLEMRKKRIHIAVVQDEYGGTTGIVTLEDIIESLVGEIEDEFDKPIQYVVKEKNNSFLVDGRTSVDYIIKKFNLPIRGSGYTTIGGLMFAFLGKEPKVGEVVQLGSVAFTITKMSKNRIEQLRVKHSR